MSCKLGVILPAAYVTGPEVQPQSTGKLSPQYFTMIVVVMEWGPDFCGGPSICIENLMRIYIPPLHDNWVIYKLIHQIKSTIASQVYSIPLLLYYTRIQSMNGTVSDVLPPRRSSRNASQVKLLIVHWSSFIHRMQLPGCSRHWPQRGEGSVQGSLRRKPWEQALTHRPPMHLLCQRCYCSITKFL